MHGSVGVVLAAVRDSVLSVDEVVAAVTHPRAGAVVTFLGTVRNHDHGTEVQSLEYTAHPSAEHALGVVLQEVAAREGVVSVAAAHRVGLLVVGDLAMVVAVSAEHRERAFDACRELVEALKQSVPVWKHQVFADGAGEWVGLT